MRPLESRRSRKWLLPMSRCAAMRPAARTVAPSLNFSHTSPTDPLGSKPAPNGSTPFVRSASSFLRRSAMSSFSSSIFESECKAFAQVWEQKLALPGRIRSDHRAMAWLIKADLSPARQPKTGTDSPVSFNWCRADYAFAFQRLHHAAQIITHQIEHRSEHWVFRMHLNEIAAARMEP